MLSKSKRMLFFSATCVVALAPLAAAAQTGEGGALEEVVVTARRQSEDILKVPGNVSALTDVVLEQRGIVSIQEIAIHTPGMSNNNGAAGSGRADRSQASIIIRGMTPSASATTSIFINGTAVPSADMIQALDNPERVEVLKGPQAAYFGRQTFAGAVNFITKTPSNTYTANLSATIGTRNTYSATGYVSGPIIEDKLLFSVSGRYAEHDGSYKNAANPGETLGDQSDRTFSGTLFFKPTEQLTIKAFGTILQNRDGPSATALYLTNAGAFSQGNCTVNNVRFICGVLPDRLSAVTPAQSTANLSASQLAFMADPRGVLGSDRSIHDFGLKRDARHVDLTVEYAVDGLTFTNLIGWNENFRSSYTSIDQINTAANGQYPGYSGFPGRIGFPFMVHGKASNISEEFRVATDPSKPFRVLFGGSYIVTHTNGSASATNNSYTASPGYNETKGLFFSLAYDVLPKLTVNFDGRYQKDHQEARNTNSVITAQGDYTNFLPRASIQYAFAEGGMIYATYSKGVNPGVFNAAYGNLPAASRARLAALGFVAEVATRPEKITNYEIGLKGRFLDGRATLSLDAYYDRWTDQLAQTSYTFALNDPANPNNLPGSTAPPSAFPFAFTANTASTTPKGIEFDGQLIPVDHVTLNASAAYNSTKYKTYTCIQCGPYASLDAKGNYLPYAPRFSATFGAMYANSTSVFGSEADYFGRVDVIYRDGVYADPSNIVRTPNFTQVNIRAGVTLASGLSIEGFVNNLLDTETPINAFQGYNFAGGFTLDAYYGTLPEKITGGLTLRFKY